jgi:hypothetical protein
MKKTIKKLFCKAANLNFFLLAVLLLGESPIRVYAQACAPVPTGLVSWYRAENNALDNTLAHPGILQGETGFVSGMVGQAFSFDGVNDYVELGNWNAGTQWSLEAWINPSSIPDGRDSIFGGNSECADWSIGFDNGEFLARVKPLDGGCATEISSGFTPSVGAWHHVAVTSDGITARIYVDGEEKASGQVLPNYMPTGDRIRIGSDTCCGNYFHGLVDEASVYSRALSLSEIQAIYNAGSAGKCLGTTAAPVSVSGRVMTGKGTAIARAKVTLTAPNGETRTTTANHFGFYRFTNLTAGETYVLSASHKAYKFEPVAISLVEDNLNLNLTESVEIQANSRKTQKTKN